MLNMILQSTFQQSRSKESLEFLLERRAGENLSHFHQRFVWISWKEMKKMNVDQVRCNIKTIHCGLSNKRSKGKQAKNLHAGGWTVSNGNDFDLYTLDYLVSNKKVGLIHFDLEGMEYEALLGSKNTISKSNPPILMEVVWDKNNKAVDLLNTYGYKSLWNKDKNSWNVKIMND